MRIYRLLENKDKFINRNPNLTDEQKKEIKDTLNRTDSLYKRLYQLIKTARLNSNLPVYLYIDNQRADVVGGEGIMLTQPLSNSSLDN